MEVEHLLNHWMNSNEKSTPYFTIKVILKVSVKFIHWLRRRCWYEYISLIIEILNVHVFPWDTTTDKAWPMGNFRFNMANFSPSNTTAVVLFAKKFFILEFTPPPPPNKKSCSRLIYVEVVNDYLTLSHAFEESIKVSVHLPSSLMFWDVVNIFIQIDLNTMATRKMNNNRK